MSVKSGKNTNAGSYFQAALNEWVKSSGQRKKNLAAFLNIAPSALGDYLNGVKVPSLAVMEDIADQIGIDLPDMLVKGRAFITGLYPNQTISPHAESFTHEQVQAIEAFKACLKVNDKTAKLIVKNAIDFANEKEAELKNLSENQWVESA